MDNLIKELKKSKKMNKFARTAHSYKFIKVEDYNKLRPLTYTILTKKTEIETVINGKLETKHTLQRGDYVMCGKSNEKYGLFLEKILESYELSTVRNKKLKRKGLILSASFLKKHKLSKKKLEITPSWGGKQILHKGDGILFELFDGSKYYGIEKKTFKDTYV